jgi:selenoprotein W-related protein
MTACPPRIVIAYCTQCHWLLRAAWMAQELPERKADGGFPDVKVLKQRVRDRLDPGRDLGHIDGPALPDTVSSEDAT